MRLVSNATWAWQLLRASANALRGKTIAAIRAMGEFQRDSLALKRFQRLCEHPEGFTSQNAYTCPKCHYSVEDAAF